MRHRAFVTGATRRVGRAIALELARRGMDLLISARHPSPELELTARLAEREGASIEVMVLDLADLEAVAAFAGSRCDERWDVLVLNASRYERSPLTVEESAADRAVRFAVDAESHFRVNAASSLALAVGLAPALSRSELPGGGAIVALGDMHTQGRPVRGFAPYLMSKAALSQMVLSLAVELAPRVRVNAVLPGVVAWPEDTDGGVRRAYEARIPLARSGTPEDAASAVAWLALDARYVTGTELRVDGGRWLR